MSGVRIQEAEVTSQESGSVLPQHPDYCILPPDMGPGTLEFLEDCTSLHKHPDRLPQPSWKRWGRNT